MRAIVVDAIGGPEVLRLREVAEPPSPGPREVMVEIHAVGVNFADTERRRGIYAAPTLPWIPGREAAGVVVAVGRGVDPGLAGARVAYYDPHARGAYAERALVPSRQLFSFPPHVDFPQMAALPQQGLTACGLLRAADLRRGQTAVVLAAAGGVGQLLVQLARQRGARVIAVVSTPEKRDAIGALGAEVIVGYDAFHLAVAALTEDRGADVVFDSVGRATAAASLAALAPYGQLLFFGDASGPPPPIDVDALYARSLRVGAYQVDIERDIRETARDRRLLTRALAAGTLRLTVSREYPLADASIAHADLESRRTVGKIVLIP